MPLPAISNVPCVETWCGLPLHLGCGTHATLVIRMLVTCGLAAAFVFALAGADVLGAAVVPGVVFVAGALVPAPAPPALAEPPVETAPPALVAAAFTAVPARPASEHDSAATTAAASLLKRSLDRLWAALIAKTIPSRAGE
jgi:hypothetical protein